MYLVLEIVGGNLQSVGGVRRKVFSTQGGSIGRSRECDLMLVSAGVHRRHASIRFVDGVFYVEGVGSNGLAVNGVMGAFAGQSRYPLKPGDRLTIDEYELAVSISTSAPEHLTSDD